VKRLTRVFPVIAILLGAAMFVACTDETTAPDVPQFAKAGAQTTEYTYCTPQPYAYTGGWIGPKGGVLQAGKNVLKVPPGALDNRVFITMETMAEDINHVVLGPEGLAFSNKSVPRLLMSYQNCSVPTGSQQKVAYVNNVLNVVEVTPSSTDPVDQVVEGKLSHFSDYVLLSTYAVVY
jgi:hypothetical protein